MRGNVFFPAFYWVYVKFHFKGGCESWAHAHHTQSMGSLRISVAVLRACGSTLKLNRRVGYFKGCTNMRVNGLLYNATQKLFQFLIDLAIINIYFRNLQPSAQSIKG